jgi:hypothetical protein
MRGEWPSPDEPLGMRLYDVLETELLAAAGPLPAP